VVPDGQVGKETVGQIAKFIRFLEEITGHARKLGIGRKALYQALLMRTQTGFDQLGPILLALRGLA